MRVLIVSAGLKPDHFGGLPSHVEDVIRGLISRGIEVGYLNTGAKTGRTGTRLTMRKDLPCIAWDLESRWSQTAYWNGTIDPVEQIAPDAAFSKALGEVARLFRPDIVHFHELTSFPVAASSVFRDSGARTVFSAHDFFALCPTAKLQRPDGSVCDRPASELDCDLCSKHARPNHSMQVESAWDQRLGFSIPARNFARRLIRARERATVEPPPREAYQARRNEFLRHLVAFDAILMTSRDQTLRFEKHAGPGLKLHLLPLSRTTFCELPPAPRASTVVQGKTIFLALNIVNPAKGITLLEDTFGELALSHPGAELHLYGPTGDSSPAIRRLGHYDDSRLDEIIASADFGILPSLWPEAYGYVGPEMLSRGLPVIASNIGAMPDYVVHNGNGLLFDPNAPNSLVETLRDVLEREELRLRLWAGAVNTPRRFLLMHEHVDQLLGVYGELLGQPALQG